MKPRTLLYSALLLAAVSTPTLAQARDQMRVVGSSTVYPFAKAVAERVAQANPKVKAPAPSRAGVS